MRRLLWIVPSIFAVALTGYILARPSAAPADPTDSAPAAASLPSATRVADHPRRPVQQRRRLLPARRRVEGNTRVDLTFPVAGRQRPAQEHGPARPRRRPHQRRQLRQSRSHRQDAEQLRHQPDRQPVVRPDSQPGPRREGRGHAATSPSAADSPALSHGTIMGVEKQREQPVGKDAAVEVELLNLWCAEGMRSLKLAEMQRVTS